MADKRWPRAASLQQIAHRNTEVDNSCGRSVPFGAEQVVAHDKTSKFGSDNACCRGVHSEGLCASHTNTLMVPVLWERYAQACQTMKIATITLP